jgi:hypothetical protein
MREITIFILTTIGIGIIFSMPTVLIQLWLIKIGAVREGVLRVIIGVYVAVLIIRIWFNDTSWLCSGLLIIIVSILGMNRGDLWDTMQYGTWWWKTEKKN